MLYKTYQTFDDRIEYTKTHHGHWRARFQGIVDVDVEFPSLRRCQADIMHAFDDRLAELVLERRDPIAAGDRKREPNRHARQRRK